MNAAPTVVHPPSPTGGRRVTVRQGGLLGIAHRDHDAVEFLRRAGLEDTETLLDDPHWVEWRDGRAHEYEAA
ncbi:hypothetical protein ACFVH0_35635 [Streptomyces sp. NPDC127117]|uniref:hypothetical protein n=1 Tax=Streptomyces sp. NPDC127117 TaxID=3345368 RepID=UPI00363A4BE9